MRNSVPPTLTSDLAVHCWAGRPIAKAPITFKDAQETPGNPWEYLGYESKILVFSTTYKTLVALEKPCKYG
jgi:hypothetical protein